jgi:hypothetical protein
MTKEQIVKEIERSRENLAMFANHDNYKEITAKIETLNCVLDLLKHLDK